MGAATGGLDVYISHQKMGVASWRSSSPWCSILPFGSWAALSSWTEVGTVLAVGLALWYRCAPRQLCMSLGLGGICISLQQVIVRKIQMHDFFDALKLNLCVEH